MSSEYIHISPIFPAIYIAPPIRPHLTNSKIPLCQPSFGSFPLYTTELVSSGSAKE